MSTAGTLDDILGQIQALVSDKLQVVSYKWLSRNFSMSSNDAKRVLQEFVNKHGNELEVIYTLSGWLKKNPEIYNVRLVSGSNLTDAKQQFKDNYSVQVYSVQTCIPKDPAVIWSAEFVQAEELFDQPSTTDNCLRDNRFCGVSNLFVKRIVNGKSIALDPPKTKIGSEIAVPWRMLSICLCIVGSLMFYENLLDCYSLFNGWTTRIYQAFSKSGMRFVQFHLSIRSGLCSCQPCFGLSGSKEILEFLVKHSTG